MSKLVILNLGTGNLNQGFPFVSVSSQSGNYLMQVTGHLPPIPELVDYYQRWQSIYHLLYQSNSIGNRQLLNLNRQQDSSIFIHDTDLTHVSEADLLTVATQFKDCLDRWLNSDGFQQIERSLRQEFDFQDEIRFIIQTSDQQSRQIPWSIWQFFQDYPYAEIALSPLDFKSVRRVINPAKQVRILAVLGNSSGIDVETDRALLENLQGANVVFLVEPSRQQLDEWLWDQAGWDILFFAGHSCSEADGKSGEIQINPTEKITITQLKNALNRALKGGLQLAIFNSCQGLGLAHQLSDLHFPQMILMREPVPDRVAQIFLKHFLFAFSQGQSLYLSFREARERLQGIEGEFPGASWLPLIFQNPAEIPPTWNELSQGETTIMSNASSNLVATLTLHSAQNDHQYFLSSEEVTVIGRSPDCQISLNPIEYVTVSRHHAEIKYIKKGRTSDWQIRDTGTTNGTLVNDERIEGWHSLNSGDRVTLGYKGPEFIFEHSALPTTVFIPVSKVEPPESAAVSSSDQRSEQAPSVEEGVISDSQLLVEEKAEPAVEPKKEDKAAKQKKATKEEKSNEAVEPKQDKTPSAKVAREENQSTPASQPSTEAVEPPTASVSSPSPETKEKAKPSRPVASKAHETVASSTLWGMIAQQEMSHLPCAETINALAFSPDGEMLAAASGDKTIKLWNIETGEEQLSITAHKLAISAIAFSPDGQLLASASGDKTIKLWNIETGEEQLSVSTQKSIVSDLTFSPEQQLLASINDQQWLKLWSLATAEEVLSIAIPSAYRSVTTLHPNGQILASVVEGAKIALWTLY
jgi:pSer/pThr/pTyr-binding forkhead associated (FHA) protein